MSKINLPQTGMRFAYADPPYLGQGARLYGAHHESASDWDNPETHRKLFSRLLDEFSDGWAMSASTPSLRILLPMAPDSIRVCAWVKPFAVFKPGVNPAYAWEPVLLYGGRKKRSRKDDTVRDWHSENITMRRGMPGAKPPGFPFWIADLLGARVDLGDTITDLFHGSGAMLGVWRAA
jgi:hypothetical protein